MRTNRIPDSLFTKPPGVVTSVIIHPENIRDSSDKLSEIDLLLRTVKQRLQEGIQDVSICFGSRKDALSCFQAFQTTTLFSEEEKQCLNLVLGSSLGFYYLDFSPK